MKREMLEKLQDLFLIEIAKGNPLFFQPGAQPAYQPQLAANRRRRIALLQQMFGKCVYVRF
jgi:hypothetical protein